MIDFDRACALICDISDRTVRERIAFGAASGRVLADPVVAAIDSPGRDVSTMDGYALRRSDLAALPAVLEIAGTTFAGDATPPPLEPGTCVRTFTGAPIPDGCDSVIIQELVKQDGGRAFFEFEQQPARNIRHRGSDFRTGDVILPAGTWLSERAIVAAAAADIAEIEVHQRPQVAVLATGDELEEPGCARQRSGAIPDSISPGIAAMIANWGGDCVLRRRIGDDPDALELAAREALGRADIVVVTGGASVGERDYSRSMFDQSGLEPIFAKVAIKPGKPAWLARSANRLVLGLPGNPTSALVTARLFLAPLLLQLCGGEARQAWRWSKAPLSASLMPCGDRETFVRACWRDGTVDPLKDQDSGAQRALANANMLVRRTAGAPALSAGELVDVLAF